MSAANPQWFDAKRYKDPHQEVYGLAHSMRQEQLSRETRDLTNICYYGGDPLLGLSHRDYTRRGTGEKSSINVIKNMVNALHAEITQNRPRMMVVSEGGTLDIQKAAKALDKAIEGQTVEDGQEDVSPQLCKDALIIGDGIQKVFDNHLTDRCEIERILRWELIIPEAEAYYGRPRTFLHITQADRGVLAAEYEDMKDEIDKSASAEADPFFAFDTKSDLVTVVEALHLPSLGEYGDPDDEEHFREATPDGRHFICTSHARLYDKPWKRSQGMYHRLSWDIPQIGFWSSSFVDDLRSEQASINRMDRFIKESMARAGLKVLIDNQAGVINSAIDDLVGTIVRGNFSQGGQKPEWVNYATVHPEFFQHLAWRIEELYKHNGVNQMSAQASVPAGLNSGKAIRAFEQSKSRRFIDFAKRYEKFHLKVAEYKTELMRDIYKRTGRYAVTYHGKKAIELVDWDKFKGLRPNQYRVRVFPTSALPSSPAGRISTLQEWMNAGLITGPDFKRLADFPDIEEFSDLENASHDLIKEMLDAMLEEGKWQKPEPLMDLTLAMSMATNAYLLARVRGWYPKANLVLVVNFVTTCSWMLNTKAEAQKPPPVDLATGMPPMNGAPPGLPPMLGGAPPPAGAPPPPGALPPPN